MRLKFLAPTVALALTTLLCPVSHAQDSGDVAVVNGVPISQAKMAYVMKTQLQQGQKDSEDLRKNVRDALITRELLAQEAVKQGLEKNPDVVTQLEMAKQEFLIRAYFDEFLKKNSPTDEEMKAEYEKIKNEQAEGGKRQEYKARHILVKTEKEAKAVLASLQKSKGKNFAQLAKQKSLDKGSKAEGGALEWSDGSNYVPEFSAALTKLKKGEYTKTPVKTNFGYHIILLEDERPLEFPPFDQVKDRVQQQMMTKKRDQMIEQLRAAAKIE